MNSLNFQKNAGTGAKVGKSEFSGGQGPPERQGRRRLEGFCPNPRLRLLDQCREVMRFHHFSHRTEKTYVGWIRRFIVFHGKRHPREMGKVEISRFLSHLVMGGTYRMRPCNEPYGMGRGWLEYLAG